MARLKPKAWAGLAAISVLLGGCSTADPADISQLTIHTTPSVLDQATSMAVSAYVEDQGTEVEVEQHDDASAVFDALQQDSGDERVAIGVVTAQHEATEDAPLQLPNELEIVSQAPAELELTAAASTITTAQWSREQQEQQDSAQTESSDHACADMTWIPAATPPQALDTIRQDLASQGCEPTFESAGEVDDATTTDVGQRLTTEADTVAMLYSIDPVIVDQGLASLEVDTDSWPVSNVVAVADEEIDESLAQRIGAVIETIEGDSATTLLRGYHDATVSASDLRYEVDDAIRYWLVEHELLDEDTVAETSTDSD